MPDREIAIPFPIGGLEKRAGYQSETPQFTPECVNVMPEDAEEGRSRGGSRQGIQKRYSASVGTKARLIEVVESSVLNTNAIIRYLVVAGSDGYYVGKATRFAWAVDNNTDASAYTNPNDRYDVNNDGVVDSSDATAITNFLAAQGSGTVDLASIGHTPPPYYDVTGDGTASSLDSLVIINRISSATSGSVSAEASGPVEIDYTEDLVALSGVLQAEDGSNLQTEAGENIEFGVGSVDFVRRGSAAQMGGKLLIADTGTYSVTGSGSIASNVLTATGYDWQALNVASEDHVVVVTPTAGSNVAAGTYRIASLTSTNLTLVASLSDGGCTFEVIKGLKTLDPVTEQVALIVETAGTTPGGATLVATYRDRAVWAKDRAWYMSRQGDHTDYNYGADAADVQRAVAGTVSEAGQPGNAIVALAPSGDDYLIMFSDENTWVLRGDPAFGGQIDNISRAVGAVGSHAWCHGPSGEVYFLSKSGLFAIAPGASSVPQPVSEQNLPRDLKDIDFDNNEVSLVYDGIGGGIFVFAAPRSQIKGTHYWYDFGTRSFWPQQFGNNDHQPVGAVAYSSNPTAERTVTMLGHDGYIRHIKKDDSQTNDDGTALNSQIVLGPFNAGGATNAEAVISEVASVLDLDTTANVTMQIFVGDTAEAARDAATLATSPKYTASFVAGRTRPKHPRIRANSFCIRLSSSGRWAYESIVTRLAAGGRIRS